MLGLLCSLAQDLPYAVQGRFYSTQFHKVTLLLFDMDTSSDTCHFLMLPKTGDADMPYLQ